MLSPSLSSIPIAVIPFIFYHVIKIIIYHQWQFSTQKMTQQTKNAPKYRNPNSLHFKPKSCKHPPPPINQHLPNIQKHLPQSFCSLRKSIHSSTSTVATSSSPSPSLLLNWPEPGFPSRNFICAFGALTFMEAKFLGSFGSSAGVLQYRILSVSERIPLLQFSRAMQFFLDEWAKRLLIRFLYVYLLSGWLVWRLKIGWLIDMRIGKGGGDERYYFTYERENQCNWYQPSTGMLYPGVRQTWPLFVVPPAGWVLNMWVKAVPWSKYPQKYNILISLWNKMSWVWYTAEEENV